MKKEVENAIVDDVRRAREQIAGECGYDLRRMLDMLKKRERASRRKSGSPRKARSSS